MNDKRLDLAIDLLTGRSNWAGAPTVLGCLRGVDAEQAAWKPAADRKSIWELVLHIAYWKYAVRRRLEGAPKSGFARKPWNFPALPSPADAAAWKRDRALLKREHEQFISAVRGFAARGLDRPEGSGRFRYVDLVYGIAIHDVHHVGQIQLMKRLYAEL